MAGKPRLGGWGRQVREKGRIQPCTGQKGIRAPKFGGRWGSSQVEESLPHRKRNPSWESGRREAGGGRQNGLSTGKGKKPMPNPRAAIVCRTIWENWGRTPTHHYHYPSIPSSRHLPTCTPKMPNKNVKGLQCTGPSPRIWLLLFKLNRTCCSVMPLRKNICV